MRHLVVWVVEIMSVPMQDALRDSQQATDQARADLDALRQQLAVALQRVSAMEVSAPSCEMLMSLLLWDSAFQDVTQACASELKKLSNSPSNNQSVTAVINFNGKRRHWSDLGILHLNTAHINQGLPFCAITLIGRKCSVQEDRFLASTACSEGFDSSVHRILMPNACHYGYRAHQSVLLPN